MNLLKEGLLSGKVIKTDLKEKMSVSGSNVVYSIYKVDLDILYYNDQNDRIATWINRYKSEHNIQSFDKSDLNAYNNIIHSFIVDSNNEAHKKTKNNISLIGQQRNLIVLKDGRIIDGNRRFTCLRELSKTSSEFNYANAIILEEDLENNPRDIKLLELRIQHGEDEKVGYSPIDRLMGIYNDLIKNKLLDIKDYATAVNKPISDVLYEKEIAELLANFLEFIGLNEKFYIAKDLNAYSSLKYVYIALKRITSEALKIKLLQIMFAIMLLQDSNDELSLEISNIKKISTSEYVLQDFIEKAFPLAEQIRISLQAQNNNDINDVKSRITIDQKIMLNTFFDNAVNKMNVMLTKNKPKTILSKAYNEVIKIDERILFKLSSDERKSLDESCAKLIKIVESIRNSIKDTNDW